MIPMTMPFFDKQDCLNTFFIWYNVSTAMFLNRFSIFSLLDINFSSSRKLIMSPARLHIGPEYYTAVVAWNYERKYYLHAWKFKYLTAYYFFFVTNLISSRSEIWIHLWKCQEYWKSAQINGFGWLKRIFLNTLFVMQLDPKTTTTTKELYIECCAISFTNRFFTFLRHLWPTIPYW